MTKMAATRVNDITEVDTLDGATLREALGEGQPAEASTALATTNANTQLATMADLANDFDDGSRAFREHFGLTMPRLKSDFGRNGKGWVDDLTGDPTDHLRIVILAMPPSRTFWHKSIDDGAAGPPDCKSTNLLADRPDDNVPDPQSPKCSTCAWSQWGTKDDGSPLKPKCSEAVNVLAYDLDGERFVWLAFRGMSISPFRKYVSALYSRKLPAFGVETTVTLEERKEGSLQFLVAKFGIGDPLDVALAVELRGVAKQAMVAWQTTAEEMAATEARTDAYGESTGPFGDAPRASSPDDEGEF